MQLFAVDGAGQEGQGPPLRFVLPERKFSHPAARAIVEERRILRWEGRGAAAERLDGIAAGAELYDRDPAVTLALAVASARLRMAEEEGACPGECAEPVVENGAPPGGWRPRPCGPRSARFAGRPL